MEPRVEGGTLRTFGAAILRDLLGQGARGQPPEVHVFTSHVLFEHGVRCGKNWSPLALQASWRPGALRIDAEANNNSGKIFPGTPQAEDLMGCTIKVAAMENAPYMQVYKGHPFSAPRTQPPL